MEGGVGDDDGAPVTGKQREPDEGAVEGGTDRIGRGGLGLRRLAHARYSVTPGTLGRTELPS